MFAYLLHAHDNKPATALCRCDICGTLYEIPLDEVTKELEKAVCALYLLNFGDDLDVIAERAGAVNDCLEKVIHGDFDKETKGWMICFCERHRGDFLNSKTRR